MVDLGGHLEEYPCGECEFCRSQLRRPINSGHGHVVPRPDGVKARCGGPAICSQCAKEAAQLGPETP